MCILATSLQLGAIIERHQDSCFRNRILLIVLDSQADQQSMLLEIIWRKKSFDWTSMRVI